jgi:hypothetical protein
VSSFYTFEETGLAISGRLCGLVARAFGYRSRGPSSIAGAARFSEK